MTWEEKLYAMIGLCGTGAVVLIMRSPGDWYVSARGRNVKVGIMLEGRYGNGRTPEEAVENDWKACVENLNPDEYLVVDYGYKDRRAVRWNGFMWEDYCE